MTPPQDQEEALFRAAIHLVEGPARQAFLEQACAGDPQLRQRVEALIAAHEAQDTLRTPEGTDQASTVVMSSAPEEGPGAVIGRYKLLEKIGEGGFGAVYAAEQKEPVKRRVALKIIKLGMDTKQVVARFEAERQAVALMDHPNIAKVLEAGSTQTGRPYFVMELVKGIPITKYCDQQKLATRDRLDLFIKVCHAIQHAHQKGIIHRDIKPSNILVTLHDGVPVPKVIDFGIAKATQQELTEKTVYTQLQQFIGTPAYMSPEQAEMSGLDIDTRSDIYSLGVLLYELLTGSTPFDSKELVQSGLDEMRKIIREREPVRPSTRLRQTSSLKVAPAQRSSLSSALSSDLDWIVMRCLEKDRTRRYETANGLALDLKRHLNNEAVSARPPSTAYRLQKAFRRHKLAFAAAAAVAAALALGIVVSTWQAVLATRAKREADMARRAAERNATLATAESKRAQAAELAASNNLQTASRNLYAADMLLAQAALAGNDLGGALKLLNRHGQKSGEPDLRGWEWRYLWKLCRSDERFTLCTLSNEVLGVLWYPDGQHLLTLENHGALTLWDTLARKQAAFNPRGKGWADNVLALSPDGQTIVNPTETGIRFLEASTLREVAPPLIVSNNVQALTFDRDGRRLLVFGNESIAEWDLDTRRSVSKQSLPAGYSASTAQGLQTFFSPDRRGVVLTKDDGAVLVWDRVGAHSIADFQGPSEARVRAFAPDGDHLAISFGLNPRGLPPGIETASVPYDTNPGELRVWEVSTLREVQRLTNHIASTYTLAYSPNGQLLATGGIDQKLRLWDTSTWREVARLRGHLNEIWNIGFSPDGKSIATGSKDQTVRIWNAAPRREEQTHFELPDPLDSFAFSPQGDLFFTLSAGRAEIRESHSLRLLQTHSFPLSLHEMHSRSVGWWERPGSTAVSPHGSVFAFATEAGPIELWDGMTWKKITELPSQGSKPPDCMAFSAKGDRLLSREEGSSIIRVWSLTNLTKPELIITNQLCLNDLCTPVFSPDGNSIASMGSDERTAEIWDVRGKTQGVFAWHLDDVFRVAFSMDGRFLATSSGDGTAAVWDLGHPRQPMARLRGQLMNVDAFAFSPDGHRLAAGNGEGTIKLYDFAREQELAVLHTEMYMTSSRSGVSIDPWFGDCMALFFIDDDTLVARVGNNIIVWHATSAAEIAEELSRGEGR